MGDSFLAATRPLSFVLALLPGLRYCSGMGFDIKDLATITAIQSHLKDLLEACEPRKAFYAHDKHLTNAVIREAKGLQTSLGYLQRALDNPNHKPHEPAPSEKEPLVVRLEREPHLYELARFVSFGGKRPDQMKAFMEQHREKYGSKSMWALQTLTTHDERTGLTELRPDAKRACRVLLGPTPDSDEYSAYWKKRGTEPPADHQPPGPAEAEPEAPKKPRRNCSR